MRSTADEGFWEGFEKLPINVQNRTKKQFLLWKENPKHPRLHFKQVDAKKSVWSVRISKNYREN